MGLILDAEGDRAIRGLRRFRHGPMQMFRAHTEPMLIRQWMLGPPGWAFIVCRSEPRAGGSIQLEWTDGKAGLAIRGSYLALEPPADGAGRILHTERWVLPEPGPENRVETVFDPADGGTMLRLTMNLPDAASRDAMLATEMRDGMEASYARLDALDL